jgi:hypothetical protein
MIHVCIDIRCAFVWLRTSISRLSREKHAGFRSSLLVRYWTNRSLGSSTLRDLELLKTLLLFEESALAMSGNLARFRSMSSPLVSNYIYSSFQLLTLSILDYGLTPNDYTAVRCGMNIARAIKEGTIDAGIGLENVQMCEVYVFLIGTYGRRYSKADIH